MKNIAIFGASRSGKTTLSKMICKKYPNYNMIVGDAIKKSFDKVLPQNNINSKFGSGMLEDFPKFLAYTFHESIKRVNKEFNYIIDTCDISPEKAKELFYRQETVIIFLGFPRQTEEEHLMQIKKYEKENDWTYNKDNEYMKAHAQYWTTKSRLYEEKCKELDIWFVDTSFNRENVLNETMKKLEKVII